MRIHDAILHLAIVAATASSCAPSETATETSPSIGAAGSTAAYAVTGIAPRATGGFPSVVSLEPADAATPPPSRFTEPLVMDQYGNAFHPKVLIAPAGEQVSFKNSEDVLHNVRVVSRDRHDTIFNVATPVVGSYEHRFELAGVYDVSCEIHPAMAAFVVVTDAPYAVVAETEGDFAIDDVAAGAYDVVVWNLDPERKRELRVTIDRNLDVDLTRDKGETP